MTDGTRRPGDSVIRAMDLYGGMVYRIAYARTRSRFDADDIYQEVFLRMYKSAPVFNDAEHEKAWLIRASVNASVNLLKSAWRRLTVSQTAETPG